MNKQFSFWEVMISGVIILVLAFVLIGSLAILYQSNLKLSITEERASCLNDLDRIISSEFANASRVYAVQMDSSGGNIQKINSTSSNFPGIAFLKNDQLKVFIKKSDKGQSSYFYSSYKLDGNLDFDDKKALKEIGNPTNTQNLFMSKCRANLSSESPFSLRTIDRLHSNKRAVMVLFQDEIFSLRSESGSKLFVRRINEYN